MTVRALDGGSMDPYAIYHGTYVTPEGLTTIAMHAFNGNRVLTELILSKEVTTIRRSAFAFCHALTQVIRAEGTALNIEEGAFTRCTVLEQMNLEGVMIIARHAFLSCSALRQVKFDESTIHIDDGAFANCTSLKYVELFEGLMTLGRQAFFGCTVLKQVKLPEGVETIAESAFDNCPNLQVIVINTEHDDEVERIKNFLPEEHKQKVIKKSQYHRVIALRRELYTEILRNPMLGDYRACYVLLMTYALLIHNKSIDLAMEIVIHIASFDTGFKAFFKQAMGQLTFPITEDDVKQYEIASRRLLNIAGPGEERLAQVRTEADAMFTQEQMEPILCAAKLRLYVAYIEHQKAIKQEKSLLFFVNMQL